MKADNHLYYSTVYAEPVSGPAGYKEVVTAYRTALPDLQLTIEDMVLEGNKGAFRWTMRGTHQGDLFGIPATGKAVTFVGVTIARVREDGKSVEEWVLYDNFGLMQQIGVVSL